MPKTVPLSARITHEDAEFLAKLKIDNATTPSDKVRAILSEYKKQSLQSEPSYSQALNWVESIISPISSSLRDVQHQEKLNSELLRNLNEWLPDILALYITQGKAVQNKAGLDKLESDILDRVFRLIELILRMGVTQESPCIDKQAISKRINNSLQLANVIQDRLSKATGE